MHPQYYHQVCDKYSMWYHCCYNYKMVVYIASVVFLIKLYNNNYYQKKNDNIFKNTVPLWCLRGGSVMYSPSLFVMHSLIKH